MSAQNHTKVAQASPIEVEAVAVVDPRRSDEPLVRTIADGHMPNTEQVNMAIDHAKVSLEKNKDAAHLNSRGDMLAQDTQELLDSAQRFINVHNADGKLQDLMLHSKQASHEVQKEAARMGAVGSTGSLPSFLTTGQKVGMARDAKHGLNYGKDLAMYIFQSGEFKTLLLEAIDFIQNVLNDGTHKLNRLGDSLKDDIQHNDTHIVGTKHEALSVKEESKASVRAQAQEWNEARRTEIYERFRGLLNRASRTPEFQNLVRIFFKWMEQLKQRAILTGERLKSRVETKVEQVKEHAKDVKNNADETPFDLMLDDIRQLVDEFAGRGSFDQFYNNSWDLYVELAHDQEASLYFDDLTVFIMDAMDHPENLNLEVKTKQGQLLIERGRFLIQSERYRSRFDQMFDNAQFLMIKIKNDETTVGFKQSLKKWGEHFALDNQGRPDLYVIQESLSQLKNLAYPILREKLGHLRIARIEGTTDKVDYSIEDLTVSVPDLLPKYFELQTKTDLQVDFEDLSSRSGYVKASLDLRKLKPIFKNVKFWFKKKTFPKIEDHGVLDVDLSAGEGTRIKVVWKIITAPNKPFSFSLVNVKCTVDKMDIDIKNAKHEFLDKMATSLFIGKIKASVAQAIVDGIVGALQPINNQMNQWFATRPINSIKEQANEQFHMAFDKTNAAIKDHPVDKLSAKAGDLYDAAAIKAISVKETVKVQAEDMKDTIKDNIVDAKQTAMDAKNASSNPDLISLAPATITTTTGVATTDSEEWHFEWYSTPKEAVAVEKVEVFPAATTTTTTTVVAETTPLL